MQEFLYPNLERETTVKLIRATGVLALTVSAILAATNTFGSLVPLEDITVTGTECPLSECNSGFFPVENSIDGDVDTFWHGANDLQIGEVNFLVYQFSREVLLTSRISN